MEVFKPFKTLSIKSEYVEGVDYWPEPLGLDDPWWAGGTSPRFYKWRVQFRLPFIQNHSYPYSTKPFQYSLIDVNVGDFIASGDSGKAYRITNIESKSETVMTCIIEDVYRTLTFKYNQGQSQPSNFSFFLCFNVNENFQTSIDPYSVNSQVRSNTIINIQSYLQQISFIQYPIFKCECDFEIGDAVAIEKGVGFVRPVGILNKKIVGKVIGSTGIDKEYIVDPISRHDIISQNVGEYGDVIYLDNDGYTLTTNVTRKPMYLKTYDAIPNISKSNPLVLNPVIEAGTIIDINGDRITFDTITTLSEFTTIINNLDNNIMADEIFPPFNIINDTNKLTYGIIGVAVLPTEIRINGYPVTISTTTSGQEQYGSAVAAPLDIMFDINNANIPNLIVSYNTETNKLSLTEENGSDIIIENISGDIFASDTGNSATGFNETNTSPKNSTIIKLIEDNGKEIIIKQILGNFTATSGISGSDNGIQAKGIYYGGTVREGTNYVVDFMTSLSELSPIVGDGVHVLDGGNGEWVEMKYTVDGWVTIATQDSARTDADTLTKIINFNDVGQIFIGTVSTNSRISNITITVSESFNDSNITLNVGDLTNNDILFNDNFIDLLNVGDYTNTPSNVYSTETDLYVFIGNHNSTTGELKIVISYM